MELEENATDGGLNLPRARKWLADNGLGGYEPTRRADGTCQIVVPAKAFRTTPEKTPDKKGLAPTKLGSFIVLGSDIIHVWCRDEKLRHDVLLRCMEDYLSHRTHISASDVDLRLTCLTRQLDLAPIDAQALRHMTANAGLHGLSAQLSRIS